MIGLLCQCQKLRELITGYQSKSHPSVRVEMVQPDGLGFKIDGHMVRSVFSSSFFYFHVWTKQIYPMSFLFCVIFTLARFEIALINLRVSLSGS